MPAVVQMACKSCYRVTTVGQCDLCGGKIVKPKATKGEKKKDSKPVCESCGNEPTGKCKCGGELSREWQGYVVITDASRSQIAKNMNITEEGKYALRVR